MWVFRLPLCPNVKSQRWQAKGLFLSWTSLTCLFTLLLLKNCFPHWWHFAGGSFFPLWIIWICLYTPVLWLNFWAQNWQLYFFPSWTTKIWSCNCGLLKKFTPHFLQSEPNVFSWLNAMCLSRLILWTKCLSHCLQEKFETLGYGNTGYGISNLGIQN